MDGGGDERYQLALLALAGGPRDLGIREMSAEQFYEYLQGVLNREEEAEAVRESFDEYTDRAVEERPKMSAEEAARTMAARVVKTSERALLAQCCVCHVFFAKEQHVKLLCGHRLHSPCFWKQAREYDRRCPICREDMCVPQTP